MIWLQPTTYLDDSNIFWTQNQYFGNHIFGTACRDSINPHLAEWVCGPDCGPTWQPPNRAIAPCYSAAGSTGFYRIDIRGVPSDPSKADTFIFEFDYTPFFKYTRIVFHWPDPGYLGERCDSLFIEDLFGGTGRTNLFIADSLSFNFSYALQGDKLRILKYGARLVDGVRGEGGSVARSFALLQNVPNPFNPTTSIVYNIPKQTRVRLEVYDVLGHLLTSLVDAEETPGTYSVTWDAGSKPSGVYFYKLSAGNYVQTRKMLALH